jgi:SAM-dependent methyltransferase
VTEFTGERVIPGQVDADLWAEHMARYAFASRMVEGKRVLDVGCGTGYGTAELAKHASEAVGVDVSPDAIDYASEHFRSARFVLSGAADLPFPSASFDVVTSFELIEHLSEWRGLLSQARRVLHPGGVFVVSTPNKLYYAEARGLAGPNPFHEHEFEYSEFGAALREFFPNVKILLQDRLEAFGFYEPRQASQAQAEIARATGDADAANFFLAICSTEPLPDLEPFLYVPAAANLLRERERHVHKLELELDDVRRWLEETTRSRNLLLARQSELEKDARDKAAWALEMDGLLKDARAKVEEMAASHAASITAANHVLQQLNAEIERLNEEGKKLGEWGRTTSTELAAARNDLKQTVEKLDRAEATVIERTEWAQRASAEADSLQGQLARMRESRWMKLGRTLGLGPDVK